MSTADAGVRSAGAPPAAAGDTALATPVSRLQADALRRVFEHLSEGLVLATMAGEVVHWNRAAIAMHGLNGPDGQLRPLSDLQTAYRLETLEGAEVTLSEWPLVRTLRGETVRDLVLRLRRLDHSFERVFSYGGSIVVNEAGEAQLGVLHITDVTARYEAERSLAGGRARQEELLGSLREREGLLSLLLDQLPVVLWSTDRDLRFTSMRGAALRDTDFEPQRMIGRQIADVPVPDAQESLDRHQAALDGRKVFYDVERAGRMLRGMVAPLHEADGAITGTIGMTMDVTEQHRADEEIRRLNTDLERRVAERTAELAAANAELESFAYAVAHDLRAPLRAMAGFARALMDDYRDRLEGEASEYVDEIIGASRTMGNLIDAMLSLSRHTRGGLQRGPVDVSAQAERILRGLGRAEVEREVAWSVAPHLEAWGDTRMVDVVLHNLLSNAWKYTSRAASPRIRVAGAVRDEMLHVSVSDNGAGFSMDHAAKLFQPFQRLHRQDEFPGIGIGLATVQRIVRRHGGSVTAHGKPGEGAFFEFSLPLAPAATPVG